jgi:hypothetical protein
METGPPWPARARLGQLGRVLNFQGAPGHIKGAPWYTVHQGTPGGGGNAKADLGDFASTLCFVRA